MASGEGQLPYPWSRFLIGRVVRKANRTGVAKFFDHTKWGHDDAEARRRWGGVAIDGTHLVEWDDGRKEVLPIKEVERIATPRFLEAEWVHPVVLYLQRRDWEDHKMDVKELTALAAAEAKAAADAAKKAAAAERRRSAAAAHKAEGAGKAGKENADVAKKKKQAAAKAAGKAGEAGAAGRKRKAPAAGDGPSAGGKKKKVTVKDLEFKNPGLEEQLFQRRRAGAAGTAGAATTRPAPAAAAAQLQLAAGQAQQGGDQGGSNTVPVAFVGDAAAAAGTGREVTSPRGGGSGGGTSAAAAKVPEHGVASASAAASLSPTVAIGKAAAAKKKRASGTSAAGKAPKRSKSGHKPAGTGGSGHKGANASASSRLTPLLASAAADGLSAASPSAAGVAQPPRGLASPRSRAGAGAPSLDIVSQEQEDLAVAGSYSHEAVWVEGQEEGEPPKEIKMFRYNLREGPDGKLYRIYSSDLVVLDSHCCSARDRRCRRWKLQPAADVDYGVQRIVAERHFPGVWSHKIDGWKVDPGTQYLVKWSGFELDLSAGTDRYQDPDWQAREDKIEDEDWESSWFFPEDLEHAQARIKQWEAKGREEFLKGLSFFVAPKPAAAGGCTGGIGGGP